MRLSLIPARRKRLAYGLYGASAAMVAASLALIGMAPANADAPGTDWGSNGAMSPTSSAVTVQWDNGGSTPAVDAVPRNASQVIPHTDGKSYLDVDPGVSSTIADDFGGMKLTVSQTAGLRHQAIQLTVSGAKIGAKASAGQPNALLVMQCWGSADETAPDPQHCQDGVGNVDGTPFAPRGIVASDAGLTANSDYKASTSVDLLGQPSGKAITFEATVHAAVFNPTGQSDVASGAHGQVQILDPNLKVIGSGPVADGVAMITVMDTSGTVSDYTAQYVATPDEAFVSSAPSQPGAALPYRPSTTPGFGDNTSPNLTATIPFEGVDRQTVTSAGLSNYFTATTTNEIGVFPVPATTDDSDKASRAFEVQTGAESPGLGCGKRGDMPSTSVCWLVAIPFDSALSAAYQIPAASPLTPSLWAQRVQVQLQFADVTSSCGGGTREISSGSELLVGAMNSWIPALCAQSGVDLGYIQNGDISARSQYSDGTAQLIFTSQPVDDSIGGTSTLYAPVSLAGITISVLAVNADTRAPVTGIKLNARIIAKLLTESYRSGIDGYGTGSQAQQNVPWSLNLPFSLKDDPEFQKLNPTFPTRASLTGSDLIVTVAASDATVALWNWLLSDPESRAFLDGCPDTESPVTVNGVTTPSVINPFFSTRSYAECQDQAASLEATAASWRSAQSADNPEGTVLPKTYVDTVPSYPPQGAAFNQPGYYERNAITDPAHPDPNDPLHIMQLPLTLADLHPRENTFAQVATDVFRGQEKSLGFWCTSILACSGVTITPPGVWVNNAGPSYGSGVLGLTTAQASAADLLPTALLCDDSGSICTSANNASLQAAANSFVPSTTSDRFMTPGKTVDWTGGAYPLTLPVYAEIDTKGLEASDAGQYAKALQYIAGSGQSQGYEIGQLPPGMAPLTDGLKAQTSAAISTLQSIAAVTPPPAPTKTPKPTKKPTSTPSPTRSAVVPPVNPIEPPQPPAAPVETQTPQPVVTSTPTPLPTVALPQGMTPAAAIGPLPGLALAGLIGALIAGIAAPIIGRPRKARA